MAKAFPSTPWKLNENGPTDIVCDRDNVPVAYVYGLDHPMPSIAQESITHRDLIAAAPDLLAACETALTSITWTVKEYQRGLATGYDTDAMKALRAAIAKAKGGAV